MPSPTILLPLKVENYCKRVAAVEPIAKPVGPAVQATTDIVVMASADSRQRSGSEEQEVVPRSLSAVTEMLAAHPPTGSVPCMFQVQQFGRGHRSRPYWCGRLQGIAKRAKVWLLRSNKEPPNGV